MLLQRLVFQKRLFTKKSVEKSQNKSLTNFLNSFKNTSFNESNNMSVKKMSKYRQAFIKNNFF